MITTECQDKATETNFMYSVTEIRMKHLIFLSKNGMICHFKILIFKLIFKISMKAQNYADK